MSTRAVLLFSTMVMAAGVDAATRWEIMRSRYMTYQFCMEQVFKPGAEGHGKGVYHRIGLDTAMNRWGISEPTSAAIRAAPVRVKKADESCRLENQIDQEPRPQ